LPQKQLAGRFAGFGGCSPDMSETHTDIVVFWWHCIRTGWGIGYGIFDAFVTICLLASAGISLAFFLFKRFKPKKWEWKPWEDWLMKIAFSIFGITFLLVAIVVGPFREYRIMENAANFSNAKLGELSASNSYLNGVIDGSKTTVQNLQKQVEDARHDAATANLTFKTDLNEANRQRDVALQRLEFWEANPEKLIEAYSNILARTPTNFEQFNLAFHQLSASLKDINAEKPQLVLKINNVTLTNVDNTPGAVVPAQLIVVKKSDRILLSVENMSTISATHIVIEFLAPIDTTNVMSVGWQGEPQDAYGRNHWDIMAEKPTGHFATFLASPLIISSNYQASFLQASIYCRADNSITYESLVALFFQ
jgi:outer membrane murein-binding lipoprotein Lpp